MKILGYLRSVRTALVLILLMALLSVAGTLLSPEAAGRYFVNPLSILLFLLLSSNILLCTWHRSSRAVRARGWRRRGGKPRILLDIAVHLSLVVLLAGGAVKSAAGSIGTQYLFVGGETSSIFSWEEKSEVPLGFSLLLRERVKDWYPFMIQVGVRNAETGEKLGVLQPQEGRPASLPGGDLRVSISAYSVEGKNVVIDTESAGRTETVSMDLFDGGTTSITSGRYRVSLLAWRRDLKNVRGRIAVLDDGREVKEEWLKVNGRIAYRGWSIFITSWGEDEYRNPYIGAQVTRDPGAPVFWTGAALLAAALPLFLWVRRTGPRETDGNER